MTAPTASRRHSCRWSDFVVEQFVWLERALAASKADWKIVVGHHPVFSGGMHGASWGLIRYLKPMLEEHGVRVYLNGHDHDLQHIAVDGVHYLTCGAGAEPHRTEAASGGLFAQGGSGLHGRDGDEGGLCLLLRRRRRPADV